MIFAWNLATAGLGHLIWHWGVGIGLIIILVAAAELTTAIPIIGDWLEKVRKDLLWVAVGIALILVGEWVGKKDADARCEAKAAVVSKEVTTEVTKAKKDTSKQDRFITND